MKQVKASAFFKFLNIHGLQGKTTLTAKIASPVSSLATYQVLREGPGSALQPLGVLEFKSPSWWGRLFGAKPNFASLRLSGLGETETLVIRSSNATRQTVLDYFTFE